VPTHFFVVFGGSSVLCVVLFVVIWLVLDVWCGVLLFLLNYLLIQKIILDIISFFIFLYTQH